jgi:hypothetical protein
VKQFLISSIGILSIGLACFPSRALAQQAPAAAPAGTGQGPFAPRVAEGPKVPDGPAPRTADGKVDLSGNWAPNAIRMNINLADVGARGAPLQEPEMSPWALKVYQEHRATISKDDPEARCLPPGVPRMSTTPYPWTIIQTPKLIVIVYEGGAHIWRKIFMDGRAHDPNAVETWLGDSVGHWEDNDTLVVETVGQNAITWLDEDGHPHTNKMVVTERIKRPDAGHLEIEHTIVDPDAYPKGWKFTTHPIMLKGELIEYICQENNRDVEHLKGK